MDDLRNGIRVARRSVPTCEGLEGRRLLSASHRSAAAVPLDAPGPSAPATFARPRPYGHGHSIHARPAPADPFATAPTGHAGRGHRPLGVMGGPATAVTAMDAARARRGMHLGMASRPTATMPPTPAPAPTPTPQPAPSPPSSGSPTDQAAAPPPAFLQAIQRFSTDLHDVRAKSTAPQSAQDALRADLRAIGAAATADPDPGKLAALRADVKAASVAPPDAAQKAKIRADFEAAARSMGVAGAALIDAAFQDADRIAAAANITPADLARLADERAALSLPADSGVVLGSWSLLGSALHRPTPPPAAPTGQA